jgi:hypothetical protein
MDDGIAQLGQRNLYGGSGDLQLGNNPEKTTVVTAEGGWWSPSSTKEKRMDFGSALQGLRAGHKLTRCGWPAGMFLSFDGTAIVKHPGQGKAQEDWVNIDPDDILATDWEIVD